MDQNTKLNSSITKHDDCSLLVNMQTLDISELDKLIKILREHRQILTTKDRIADEGEKSPETKKTKRGHRISDDNDIEGNQPLESMQIDKGQGDQPHYGESTHNRSERAQDAVDTDEQGASGTSQGQRTQVEDNRSGGQAGPSLQRQKTPKPGGIHLSPPPKRKIPPIVLRDKTKWTLFQNRLRRDKIDYTRAVNTAEGIRTYPTTENDYRRALRAIEEMQLPWHSHKLPDEQNLKVVLRGIPHEIETEEIEAELSTFGFIPQKVIRMTKKRDNRQIPMPLVLVVLEKRYRKIYDLTGVMGLKITVEPLRNTKGTGQCHRCQLFGHAQTMCRAPYKCVRCGGQHMAHDCPKAAQEPPQCANCKGQHPANYGGCPNNPKNRQQKPVAKPTSWAEAARKTQGTQQQSSAGVPPMAISNANTDSMKRKDTTGTNKYAEIANALGNMLIQFGKSNPSREQTAKFSIEAAKILDLLT